MLVGEAMEYIKIGKIINTQGIKGEVRIFPLTDDLKRFEKLEEAYIGEEKTPITIEKVWYKGNLVILKFKEFDNINDVLKFKEKFIFIDEKDRVLLPKDSYFIYEIVGCTVFDMNGNQIGIVKEVMQSYSNDVYVIKDDTNKKEYLIPAVKEFVKKVNIEDRTIIIYPIEGMIE